MSELLELLLAFLLGVFAATMLILRPHGRDCMCGVCTTDYATQIEEESKE